MRIFVEVGKPDSDDEQSIQLRLPAAWLGNKDLDLKEYLIEVDLAVALDIQDRLKRAIIILEANLGAYA